MPTSIELAQITNAQSTISTMQSDISGRASSAQGAKADSALQPYDKTITPPGTTGNRTINKLAGSVNLASGEDTLVVTNSFVTTSSVIILSLGSADVTLTSAIAVPSNGFFSITSIAPATSECKIYFLVA